MALIVTGTGLTIKDVVRVARDKEKVSLHPDALKRMEKCRNMLERKMEAKEIMYGL